MAWKHLRDTCPVARKSHQCSLCERTISPGERHVYRVGTLDGEWRSDRMHERCSKLGQELYGRDDWDSHDAVQFRAGLKGVS